MDDTTAPADAKRLVRSRDDRMVAGVCGGLAHYFDINPAFYRVGFVVLTLLGGAGILIYAAAALVIPDEGRTDSVASAALRNRDERPWPVIGLGLVGIALVVLVSRASLWPAADLLWVLVLAAGVAILWAHGRGTREAPEDARGRRGSRRLLRALAITALAFVLLACAAVAAAFAVLDVSLGDGVGERTYHVSDADSLQRTYRLGIGDLDVDLADVNDLPPGATPVRVRLGIGDLHVIVPADVAVRYRTAVKFGDSTVFGENANGHNATLEGKDGAGARVLVLDVKAGAADVRIDRAVR
jgi:phage shock protein PspC (stress-responsive transcriptional regulator)